jgi:ATP-binding cassette, subfamily B (MDR/TAP), member 1
MAAGDQRSSISSTDVEKQAAHADAKEMLAAGLNGTKPEEEKPSQGHSLPMDDIAALKKLDSKPIRVDPDEEEKDPFGHLPDHEREVLRRQVVTPDVKVGYFRLFCYATRGEWLLFFISCFCTIAAGAAMPLMTVCYSMRSATHEKSADSVGRFWWTYRHVCQLFQWPYFLQPI